MAEQAIQDHEDVLEVDVIGRENSCTLVWPCKTPDMIKYFLECKEDAYNYMFSDDATISFKLEGEIVESSWYLEICPKKRSDSSGPTYTAVYLRPSKWPKLHSIKIVSLEAKTVFKIQQIGFRDDDTTEYGPNRGTGRLTPEKLTLDRFKAFNVLNNGGFELTAKISIEKVKYEKINQNTVSIGSPMASLKESNNLNTNIHNISSNDEKSGMTLVLSRLEELSTKMDNLVNIVNDIRSDNESKISDESKYCDNNINDLSQIILSLFKDNKEIANEYIEIIIKKEGFDDISTLCDLNDNDLKEIGINKKGHRIKFIKYFNKYKQTQAILKNMNNINDSVNNMANVAGVAASAAAFQDTQNEGV